MTALGLAAACGTATATGVAGWLLTAARARALASAADEAAEARAAAEAAQAALDDALEKQYNVLEAVHEGLYVVDDALVITRINEEAERLLRVGAGEAIGAALETLVDPLASELIPDIEAARRSGVPIQRLHAAPSQRRWVEIRILPAANETVISLQDVSALSLAEAQLHESVHSLQLVANNVDAVLWTVSRDARFTGISGGGLHDLGLSVDDLVHRPCSVLIDEAVIRQVFAGTPARVEQAHNERWLRHHVEPLIDSGGTIIGAVGVSLDITELKRTQRQLFQAAHHDQLTGLPNRSSLEQCLKDAVEEARAQDRRFGLLFLDLDRFKAINDTLGHGAGDDVLREVGSRLQQSLRQGDFIARMGGDEFVILLRRINSLGEIEHVVSRLIRAVSAPITVRDREVCVGVSVGCAVFPDDGTDAEALTAHADAAMYHAKEDGGGALAIYDEKMHTEVVERFALEVALRQAAERGELFLEFQPLVDAGAVRIVGCEALVRWQHPELGRLMPATFVPIAEETGDIVAIDRWVIGAACEAAARLRAIAPAFRIAVNLSPRDMRDETLPEAIAAMLERNGLDPDALIVEVTETAALDHDVVPALHRLRKLGVHVAMDDFGVGHSSLARLKKLPITCLKIDRSFIVDLASDVADQAIVASIVGVARAIGIDVIAEGVETEEQAHLVRAAGCNGAQGYIFGRPQSLAAMETLLRDSRRLTVCPDRLTA